MSQSNVGNQPVRVVMAGDGPGVLVNRDITNSVIIGPDNTIGGNNPNSASILDPLVGIPFDGESDEWACTIVQGQSVTVDFIKNALEWGPSPAMAAAQLASSGIPLIPGETTVVNHTNVALTAGTTETTTGAVNGMAYECFLQIQDNALAGALKQAEIVFQFLDSTQTVVLDQLSYTLWPGTAAFPAIIFFRGPMRGSFIRLSVQNNNSTQAIAYQARISVSSHLDTVDRALQNNLQGTSSPVNVIPSGDASSGILAAVFVNALGAGATSSQFQLPLYRGRARFHCDSTSSAGDCEIIVSDIDSPNGLATGAVYDAITNASGNLNDELQLPGTQCWFTLTNHNAAAKNVRAQLVIESY